MIPVEYGKNSIHNFFTDKHNTISKNAFCNKRESKFFFMNAYNIGMLLGNYYYINNTFKREVRKF